MLLLLLLLLLLVAVANSNGSSSTSNRVIIIIIISSSSSIVDISEYYFPYQPLLLNFYVLSVVLHQCTQSLLLRDHNGNKVTQTFNFQQSFNFYEVIFVYVVNIRFVCDS